MFELRHRSDCVPGTSARAPGTVKHDVQTVPQSFWREIAPNAINHKNVLTMCFSITVLCFSRIYSFFKLLLWI